MPADSRSSCEPRTPPTPVEKASVRMCWCLPPAMENYAPGRAARKPPLPRDPLGGNIGIPEYPRGRRRHASDKKNVSPSTGGGGGEKREGNTVTLSSRHGGFATRAYVRTVRTLEATEPRAAGGRVYHVVVVDGGAAICRQPRSR